MLRVGGAVRRTGEVAAGAPRLGQDNDEIWGELGLSATDRERLASDGVI